MNRNTALFLAAAFALVMLCLATLPACSDGSSTAEEIRCGGECSDCFVMASDGGCVCVDPEGDPPECPL